MVDLSKKWALRSEEWVIRSALDLLAYNSSKFFTYLYDNGSIIGLPFPKQVYIDFTVYVHNKTKWIWIYDREKRQYSAIEDHKMLFKAVKMPYEDIKGQTRPYKAIQVHANSNEATHSHGREKQNQDHTRPHKAT